MRAEAASVFDVQGQEFIDCIAGYGNLNLGHNPGKVVQAVLQEIKSQRPFNWPFISSAHANLVERLAEVAPGDMECSLVVNSGAEAVDSALKLARLATRQPKIICMRGAWHGFTMGALSVSERSLCRGFGPLLEGVTAVPYGEVPAVEAAIDTQTAAVIVEPIQAEGGAVVPPPDYLRKLAALCRRRRVLLIFDEIKTGIGKTGRMFACEHEDAIPDMMVIGRSLGGGVMPIGALMARRAVWDSVGYHFAMSSSSGAGCAPACAAALAALDTIEREDLCARATLRGEQLVSGLSRLVAAFPKVAVGFSGRGLLMALHTDSLKSATEIVMHCIRRGVLLMMAFCDRTSVLIEPPLCITETQMDKVLDALEDAVGSAYRKEAAEFPVCRPVS